MPQLNPDLLAVLSPAAGPLLDLFAGGALTETFANIPSKPEAASARVMRLAPDLASRQAYFAAALRQTISKVNEVHYYKYLAALMEDVPLVSPAWQPHLLAATAYYGKGSSDPEPPAMKRAREALRALAA